MLLEDDQVLGNVFRSDDDNGVHDDHHDPDGLVVKNMVVNLNDHEKMPLVESEATIDMIELSRGV